MSVFRFLKENGLFNTFEELVARRSLWDLKSSDFKHLAQGSSFSDNNDYLSIVEMASTREEIFNSFRANRQYRKILEHVTKSLGNQYLTEIKGLDPLYKDSFNKISQVNKIGSPIVYSFSGLGKASPTTIRYMHVHLMLGQYFGDLNEFKVLEIGGGFGGQAVVSTILNPSIKWLIFDLPNVLNLQKKFIDVANPNANVEFHSGLTIKKVTGDLLISNYALSEVSRKLQLDYFDNVIKYCPRGYMAWNLISQKSGDGMTIDEVLSKLPKATIVDEYPLTDDGNKIIVWGN